MNQRDAHSYGDSRSGRRPDYDSESVQGRFGRQEDWREAERRQAARKLTLREQVELEAAQMERERREAAERRAAEQRRRRQLAQQQAAEERQRRLEEEARRRNKPAEPEPGLQGRFGRQSPRPNPERQTQRQPAQQPRQQYDRQRYTHASQAQFSPREEPRTQRPVRQTPTQVDAQRQAQQRAERHGGMQAQTQQTRPERQPWNARQTQASQVPDERPARPERSSRRTQGVIIDESVQSAHGGRHMPAVQQTRQERHVPEHPQVQEFDEAAWDVDQGVDGRPEAVADPFAPQVTHEVAQETQPWAQQQGRTSSYRPSFGDPEATSRYARDSYGSSRKKGSFTVNPAGQSGKSKFDRRPNVERASSSRGSSARKLPNVSPKLIAIIAAVFVVVVLVSIFSSFAQPGGGAAGQGGDAMTSTTKQASLPTPIMSESSGITMHSAVAMEDLTEILIHNASYAYANEITTQLKEAKNTDILASHGTGRDPAAQPTGDKWMTGEFIRCFREGNAGPVMSAIDCGGPVGATVYAPVTGEVVLVKQYKLYGEIDDYRIHIQPTGRPDLDVVLIHLTDVTVKAGDKVTAGVTPMAKIRDIFQYLDESLQLKNYTAESDNGNHTHIQVNNANHPEYTALDELKPQPTTPADPAAATPTTDA